MRNELLANAKQRGSDACPVRASRPGPPANLGGETGLVLRGALVPQPPDQVGPSTEIPNPQTTRVAPNLFRVIESLVESFGVSVTVSAIHSSAVFPAHWSANYET